MTRSRLLASTRCAAGSAVLAHAGARTRKLAVDTQTEYVCMYNVLVENKNQGAFSLLFIHPADRSNL